MKFISRRTLEILEDTTENIYPIESSINPEKQKAFHRYLHPYFTKLAGNVVQEYIKHFTSAGDTVCDPFCGTGVVGIEAISLGRSSACLDLSPLAVQMSDVLLSANFDLKIYDLAVANILKSIEEDCKRIESYGTSTPILDKEKVPAFIRRFLVGAPDLKIKLPSNADVKWVRDLFDIRQIAVGNLILTAIRLEKNSKIRSALELAFCGVIARANLTYLHSTSRGGSLLHNGGPAIFGEYRYHVPEKKVYVPMFDMFRRRLKYIRDIKVKTNSIFSSYDVESVVRRGDAKKLSTYFKEKSVDYIFTDPPYGSHISYLDLTTMWDAWMGWGISGKDKSSEIIEGGDLKKSRDEYLGLLSDSMEESFKVLKPGKWMSLVFQHKDPGIWGSIVDTFEQVGFQYRNTVVQRTFNTSIHKKKNPVGVLAEQLILNFSKPEKTVVHFTKISTDLETVVKTSVQKAIQLFNGATLDEIYNTLTPLLIESGHIKNSTDALSILNECLVKYCVLDQKKMKYRLKSSAQKSSNSTLSMVLFIREKSRKVNMAPTILKSEEIGANTHLVTDSVSGLSFIDDNLPNHILELIQEEVSSGSLAQSYSDLEKIVQRIERRFSRNKVKLSDQSISNGAFILTLFGQLGLCPVFPNRKIETSMIKLFYQRPLTAYQIELIRNAGKASHNKTIPDIQL